MHTDTIFPWLTREISGALHCAKILFPELSEPSLNRFLPSGVIYNIRKYDKVKKQIEHIFLAYTVVYRDEVFIQGHKNIQTNIMNALGAICALLYIRTSKQLFVYRLKCEDTVIISFEKGTK